MTIYRVEKSVAEYIERVTAICHHLNTVLLEEAFNSYFMETEILQFMKVFHRPPC